MFSFLATVIIWIYSLMAGATGSNEYHVCPLYTFPWKKKRREPPHICCPPLELFGGPLDGVCWRRSSDGLSGGGLRSAVGAVRRRLVVRLRLVVAVVTVCRHSQQRHRQHHLQAEAPVA